MRWMEPPLRCAGTASVSATTLILPSGVTRSTRLASISVGKTKPGNLAAEEKDAADIIGGNVDRKQESR